jgi:tetratricopeptide (TPR) repeat protein
LVFVGFAGFAIALAVGAWAWFRPRPPEPPGADLTGVDPEAAEVIRAARRDVVSRPASARAWGRMGMVLRAHDLDDEANQCFRQAERLDPRDPRWPYLRGLHRLLTDPDEGIALLGRAVELAPEGPVTPRLHLAEALLVAGRLDQAQAHLEAARRLESDRPRLRLDLGRLALLREDWADGIALLGDCLEDPHARKFAATLRAEAWGRLGKVEQARAEQARAEALPDDLHWPDEFVDEVLKLQRGLDARVQESDSLARSERIEDAIAVLVETVEKYPRAIHAWWRLGDLWRRAQRLDRAEDAVRRALALDREASESWFQLGAVQVDDALRPGVAPARQAARLGEAAESFRQAIRFRPHHAMAHYDLGRCLQRLNDLPGAAAEFREALRCRPDYAPAQEALNECEGKGPKR